MERLQREPRSNSNVPSTRLWFTAHRLKQIMDIGCVNTYSAFIACLKSEIVRRNESQANCKLSGVSYTFT